MLGLLPHCFRTTSTVPYCCFEWMIKRRNIATTVTSHSSLHKLNFSLDPSCCLLGPVIYLSRFEIHSCVFKGWHTNFFMIIITVTVERHLPLPAPCPQARLTWGDRLLHYLTDQHLDPRVDLLLVYQLDPAPPCLRMLQAVCHLHLYLRMYISYIVWI